MLAATLTRSGTGTMPYTSVVHITRKVQTDMLEIGDTYEYFTEKYAQDVIHDVRIFIDEEVIDKVEFVWLEAGTNQVLDALRYVVLNGVVGLADDRPGGIRYDPILASADFRVRVYYNSRWTTDSTRPNAIQFGRDLHSRGVPAASWIIAAAAGWMIGRTRWTLKGSSGNRFVR